jgi:hypothetical protein
MKILTAVVFLLLSISANAASVTLNWTFDNTSTATCEGSTTANPLPAATYCPLSSFIVQELINGIWTTKTASIASVLRTITYPNVAPGVKTYRVVANSSGTLSAPSNEASITVPSGAPKAPAITVTISVALPSP